jgi:hypothetical protein
MDKTKQISRRHHFVPKFYLKAWEANDGKGLWLYQRGFNDQVERYRRSAKSVGFVTDLYTLHPESIYPVLNYPEDSIEEGFFAILDSEAAKIHQKLVCLGLEHLGAEDRYIWSLFLNSLIERGPSRITEVESAGLNDDIKDGFIDKWSHSKFLDNIDFDAIKKNSVRHALVDGIKEGPVIEYFAKMRWAIIHLPIQGEHFITSDKPILINAGQGESPIHCLSLSISPNKLFIAHNDTLDFDEDLLRTLTTIHNVMLMKHAETYVVSSRKLDDGPHTKYSRAIREFLAKSSL